MEGGRRAWIAPELKPGEASPPGTDIDLLYVHECVVPALAASKVLFPLDAMLSRSDKLGRAAESNI